MWFDLGVLVGVEVLTRGLVDYLFWIFEVLFVVVYAVGCVVELDWVCVCWVL